MSLALILGLLTLQGPQPAHTVSIEGYLGLKRLGEVRINPAGDAVAFTASGGDLAEGIQGSWLYVWRAREGISSPAPEFRDAAHPSWSRSGTWLSFMSRGHGRDGPPQLWVLPQLYKGEAIQVSALPGGVLDYGWLADDSVYALTRNPGSGVREIWKVAIPGGTAEHLWGGDPGVQEIAVSPAGRWIVYSTSHRDSPDAQLNRDLRLLDLESGSTRGLTDRPGPEVDPVWSPDGAAVVFRALHDARYPHSQMELFRIEVEGGDAVNLTASFDRTVISHFWPAGGDLFFTGALGVYTHIFAVRENGAVQQITRGEYNYGSFQAAEGASALFAIREAADEGGELWRIDRDGAERLSDVNAQARGWRLGRQEAIQWRAPDGLNVEGLLVYPVQFEPRRRYPLLVNPGGGPLRRVQNVLHQEGAFQVFAAHGYAVLTANPRSSSGYGEDFAMAERDDLAGGELTDLLAGIDHVIAMGLVDPSRIAVYGAGSDASLAAWLASQSPRFQVATVAYGFELVPPPGETLGASRIHLLPSLGYRRDPIPHVRGIRNPILIVRRRGTEDEPSREAYQLYRRLADLDRTVEQVQLAVADGPSPGRRRELFFHQLRWLDKHLKFGGADLFDFYLIDEWVPGSNGWQMRVEEVEVRGPYADSAATAHRYVQLRLAFRPDPAAAAAGALQDFRLDPMQAVRLAGPTGPPDAPAGTVTELFGRERLVTEMAASISVPASPDRVSRTISLRLAFELAESPAEYRLLVQAFQPVRLWIETEERPEGEER